MSSGEGVVRDAVREEIASGEVSGPRDLAERLADRGLEVEADEIRGVLRSLGAIRVEGADGQVLAIPTRASGAAGGAAAGPGAPTSSPTRLRAAVAADADWPVQVAVAAVVALLLLVAFIGWLISP